jgi:hypothetical protein
MKPHPVPEDRLEEWTRKRYGRRRRVMPRQCWLEVERPSKVLPARRAFRSSKNRRALNAIQKRMPSIAEVSARYMTNVRNSAGEHHSH